MKFSAKQINELQVEYQKLIDDDSRTQVRWNRESTRIMRERIKSNIDKESELVNTFQEI